MITKSKQSEFEAMLDRMVMSSKACEHVYVARKLPPVKDAWYSVKNNRGSK